MTKEERKTIFAVDRTQRNKAGFQAKIPRFLFYSKHNTELSKFIVLPNQRQGFYIGNGWILDDRPELPYVIVTKAYEFTTPVSTLSRTGRKIAVEEHVSSKAIFERFLRPIQKFCKWWLRNMKHNSEYLTFPINKLYKKYLDDLMESEEVIKKAKIDAFNESKKIEDETRERFEDKRAIAKTKILTDETNSISEEFIDHNTGLPNFKLIFDTYKVSRVIELPVDVQVLLELRKQTSNYEHWANGSKKNGLPKNINYREVSEIESYEDIKFNNPLGITKEEMQMWLSEETATDLDGWESIGDSPTPVETKEKVKTQSFEEFAEEQMKLYGRDMYAEFGIKKLKKN